MKQMIFYAMTEAETFDSVITLKSLADIKSKGFDSIYLEFRNTKAPRHAPRFRTAVKCLCQEASRLGLDVVIDCNLTSQHAAMLSEHPEIFTEPVSQVRVPVEDGRFTLEISTGDPSVQQIENAWLIQSSGDFWKVDEVGARCRLVSQVSEGGGCAMTRKSGAAVTRQTWVVEGVDQAELLVVLRHRYRYENRDLAHPALDCYLDRLCEVAAENSIAGVVWDEPHYGFDFMQDAYPVSDRIYSAFQTRYGYDLKSRLVDLWLDVAGRDSGQVRLDVAELQESGLATLEANFKRRALAHPGLGGRRANFFVGIHRTMHEELSDDFRIGSVDYFRHNHGLTAGCTDSVFEREDSMLTFNLLARDLGALSESGEAWNNSWGFLPTREHLHYYLRLMGCMGVRWIGHTYHGSMLFGPGYPHHPTWGEMANLLETHCGLLEQLEGATPVCDTAVVYHWRGLADFPGNYLHQHRRSFMMATLELLNAQTPVTLISPSQIAGSSFRRLLVLWPGRLDSAVWDALDAAKAAGVEILLVGPPAWKSAHGNDIGERWAKLAGCAVPERTRALRIPYGSQLQIGETDFVLNPALAVPNWQSNPERTYTSDIKAWEITGATPVATWNGRVIGVRDGSVTTIATELPQLPGALTTLWPTKRVAPRGFLAFPSIRGRERLLALCSRKAEPVTDEFSWNGHQIVMHDCRHAVLSCDDGGAVRVWGDGVSLAVKGKK